MFNIKYVESDANFIFLFLDNKHVIKTLEENYALWKNT
ncbi:MAG: hypothetical protein QOD00_1736 [Blastocatellia bacterium]|jgi:hypothetical protein|nr:hypothetical protein [Blastocatellia bacterium]